MDHDASVIAMVENVRVATAALDPKNSADPELNRARSMAWYGLVRALENAGVHGAQTEAARLLNVSREIPSRHVRKARAWIEREQIEFAEVMSTWTGVPPDVLLGDDGE
jgi:hypothetical protein